MYILKKNIYIYGTWLQVQLFLPRFGPPADEEEQDPRQDHQRQGQWED